MPPSAFFRFRNDIKDSAEHAQYKTQNEISIKASILWKQLTEEQKKKYIVPYQREYVSCLYLAKIEMLLFLVKSQAIAWYEQYQNHDNLLQFTIDGIILNFCL